jgi:hypothetical protein
VATEQTNRPIDPEQETVVIAVLRYRPDDGRWDVRYEVYQQLPGKRPECLGSFNTPAGAIRFAAEEYNGKIQGEHESLTLAAMYNQLRIAG